MVGLLGEDDYVVFKDLIFEALLSRTRKELARVILLSLYTFQWYEHLANSTETTQFEIQDLKRKLEKANGESQAAIQKRHRGGRGDVRDADIDGPRPRRALQDCQGEGPTNG